MGFKREDITPEIIREFLECDFETGLLTWRVRHRKWFKSDQSHSAWNTKYAGKPAFTSPFGGQYRCGRIFSITLLAHRVVWAHFHGVWPSDLIDHKNGAEKGDGISNLRDTDQTQNMRNAKRHKTNKSGVTGVCWVEREQKWRAQIHIKGRCISLGHFDDFEDAVAARKAAEVKYGFHKNHGRAA